MARVMSMDDASVGKGTGDFFKITGQKDRPQRVAFIPGEAFEGELVVTDTLRQKAQSGDSEAIEKIEEILSLKENIGKSLKRKSAEVWENENGQRVILYAKTEAARVFWIDNVGYVYEVSGVPDECKGRSGAMTLYGFVIVEYELDDEGHVREIAESLDLGDGHTLNFKYTMKVAQLGDPKVRVWKEQTRNFPWITSDYEVWNEKQGTSDRAKFTPAGPAVWRQDPYVMRRIIAEARKLYPNVLKTIKKFSAEEIIKMHPQVEALLIATGKLKASTTSGTREMQVEETDFSTLLGKGVDVPPAGATSSG